MTDDDILRFIANAETPPRRREIATHFGFANTTEILQPVDRLLFAELIRINFSFTITAKGKLLLDEVPERVSKGDQGKFGFGG